jgi:hypothetical protein
VSPERRTRTKEKREVKLILIVAASFISFSLCPCDLKQPTDGVSERGVCHYGLGDRLPMKSMNGERQRLQATGHWDSTYDIMTFNHLQ